MFAISAGGRLAALFSILVATVLAVWYSRARGGLPARGAALLLCLGLTVQLAGPLVGLAATLFAALVARRLSSPGRGAAFPSEAGGVLLGRSLATGRPVRIALRHMVVIGASGSGKTATLGALARRAAVSHGLVVVDGKGDPALREAVRAAALETGRRLWLWSPTGELPYNPFAHGEEGELVDKALAAETFGDSYYLRIGQRFLGFAVRALRQAGEEVTLAKLAEYVDPRLIVRLAAQMEARETGAWLRFSAKLPKLSTREQEAVAGTRHRLAALAEADVGRALEGGGGLDLLAAVGEGDVVYFNLNSDSRPELSQMVGAAILIDLLTIAGSLQRGGRGAPTLVVVDDLQGFVSPPATRALASLFARGRSAGFAVCLGTQSLFDLTGGGGERLGQLLDNRYALLVHRLPGRSSAALASRELGEVWRPAIQEQLEAKGGRWRTGRRASRVLRQEPAVGAEQIASLPVGHLFLSVPGSPPEPVAVWIGADPDLEGAAGLRRAIAALRRR